MKLAHYCLHWPVMAIASALSPPAAALAPATASIQMDGAGAATSDKTSRSDSALLSSIQAVYQEVAAFQGIEVSLRSGVVELTGTVPSSEASDNAAKVAASFDGVRYVENLLSVKAASAPEDGPDGQAPTEAASEEASGSTGLDRRVEAQLQAVFDRVDELKGLSVSVAGGVARLSGTALDRAAMDRALDLAGAMEGVLLVDNDAEEATSVAERLVPSVERFAQGARNWIARIPMLLFAALVVLSFAWLSRRVSSARRPFHRLSNNVLIQSLARQATRALILVVGLFIALELLGATALVGAVLGSVGVVSLALGLAFRDIAENYLASIILSIRRPFKSKDVVEIDGERGKVIRMTTRETALMTFDGNHVLLPNATVFKSKVINYSRAAKRRFKVGVGFGSDVDLRAAIDLGLVKVRAIPGVVSKPAPSAWIESLGDSNVLVNFSGWVNQRESDFTKVQSEAIRIIKEAMDDHGFDIPEPIYRVDMISSGPADSPTERQLSDSNVDSDRDAKGSRSSKSMRSGSITATAEQRPAVDITPDDDLDSEVDDDIRSAQEPDLLEQ